MVDTTILGQDFDSIPIEYLRQTQPSINKSLLAIEKLQENAREDIIGGGLLLV